MLAQVDLTVGRMLLFGKALGCLDQACTMAAVMALEKELFLQPFMQVAPFYFFFLLSQLCILTG